MKLRTSKASTPPAPEAERDEPKEEQPAKRVPNPPRTTTGWLTSPKFGSAGSGGAEYEPGIDVD